MLRALIPGDANDDDCVSGADFTIWADNFGAGPGAPVGQGDFNADGFVTGADFTIWADNFGAGCAPQQVPEPAAAALAIAQLAVFRLLRLFFAAGSFALAPCHRL